MSGKNILPIKGPESEAELAFRHRKELTEKIYEAILPVLGPHQTKEMLDILKNRIEDSMKPSLQTVVEQSCDACGGPMKIEEFDKDNSNESVVSCIKCGYSDVLQKQR